MPKWTYADHVAGKCAAEDIGCLLPEVHEAEVIGLTRLDTTPEGIVRAAVTTLLLAASQSRDLPSAVKAAAALLRYYAPPQRPALPPPPPADQPPAGDADLVAMFKAGRHGYQQAPTSLPSTPAQIAPPEAPAPPVRPALRVVEPEPLWWDGPGKPAA